MTRFIAVISGKGGVGKTTVSLNLAQALVNNDKEVILLDANLLSPHIGIHLGFLENENTLNKFLQKKKSIREIVHQHPETQLNFIPASSSYQEYFLTNPEKLSKIFDHLESLSDYVVIDTAPGLGKELSQVLDKTDEVLVVTQPNFPSVMEAIKSIKLAKEHGNTISGVVLNMAGFLSRHELSEQEISKILGAPIVGRIKKDSKVKKSLYKKLPLTHLYPYSKTGKEFHSIADYLCMDFTT